ncbi:polar amino acid transport system substrate-binding protein [Azospirillaceae bacterium]
MEARLMATAKILLLSTVALLLTLGVSARALADEVCRRVILSAHPTYPPFHWRNGETIIGASFDLTRRILDDLKIPYESRFVGPWMRVLKMAEQGEIDLVMALKDTPERRAFLEFTHAPTFLNPMAVFVARGGGFPFLRWEDLIGRRGGKSAGDRFGEGFDEFEERNLKLEIGETIEENFRKTIAGRIDYFVTGLYPGRAWLAAAGLSDRVEFLPKPVNLGAIHHGFSLRSPCRALIPQFDRRFHELTADGTAEALIEENVRRWRDFGKL